MTVPDVRIFGGSCQLWPNAGVHKYLGDERGHLLFEIPKQDTAMRPRAIIMENAQGLVGKHLGQLKDSKGALKEAGYK
eukprot:9334228-Alexandrium_andersonii.AAC.1